MLIFLLFFGTSCQNSTPKNLQILEQNFATDGKFLFFNGKSNYKKGKYRQIPNSDFSSFEILNYRYSKDKNNVYFRAHNGDWEIYRKKILGELHGMIWPYFHLKIVDADPQSFQIFPEKNFYAKDKNFVFKNDKILKDADPENFQFLKKSHYQKDKNFVFFRGKKIKNADAATFKILKNIDFAKDKNFVFKNGEILKDADPENFYK